MMSAMLAHPGAERADLSSLRSASRRARRSPRRCIAAGSTRFGVEVLEGDRLVRAVPHLPLEPARPRAPRQRRRARARLRGEAARRRRSGPFPTASRASCWCPASSAGLCYWGDHERSKRTFHGDTVRTGDLFERDADGFYWYRGRADDLLKVGGIWVAPLEIENCLLEPPCGRRGRGRRLRGGRPDASRCLRRRCARATRPEVRASCRTSFGRSSHRTSTRATFASWPSCPRRRPARSTASRSGTARRLAPSGVRRRHRHRRHLHRLRCRRRRRRRDARQGVLDAAGLLRRDPRRRSARPRSSSAPTSERCSRARGSSCTRRTVAENAVVDGTLAKAGIVTTRGFEDTLFATRGGYGRWSGLTEEEKRNPDRHRQAAADRAAQPDRRDPRAHRRERRGEGGGAGRRDRAGRADARWTPTWRRSASAALVVRQPADREAGCGGRAADRARTHSSRSRTRSRRSSASTSAPPPPR